MAVELSERSSQTWTAGPVSTEAAADSDQMLLFASILPKRGGCRYGSRQWKKRRGSRLTNDSLSLSTSPSLADWRWGQNRSLAHHQSKRPALPYRLIRPTLSSER
jgi:hypothetical protein